MNKIFKVIWNHATQTWAVVSELTKSRGKASSQTDERQSPQAQSETVFFKLSAQGISALMITAALFGSNAAFASSVWTLGNNSQDAAHRPTVVIGEGYGEPEQEGAGAYAGAVGSTTTGDEGALHSIAIGGGANVVARYVTAMGYHATIGTKTPYVFTRTSYGENQNAAGSVAIGAYAHTNGQTDKNKGSTARYLKGDTNFAFAGDPNNDKVTVFSIGNPNGEYTYRQLQNVAAGDISASSTDGINGSQLYQAIRYFENKNNNWHYVSITGPNQASGSNYNNDGAKGNHSIAIGENASTSVNTENATAVGSNATAKHSGAVAMGSYANAGGQESVSIGYRSSATGSESGANQYATAVGTHASANRAASNAFGSYAKADGNFSTAIGNEANATGQGATAIGVNALASGGEDPHTYGYATALGQNSRATGVSSNALGRLANATGYYATAVGANALASSENTVAIGGGYGNNNGASATAQNAIAIGYKANSTNSSTVAIGANSDAKGESAVALGGSKDGASGALAEGKFSTAIGANARANGNHTIAIGGSGRGNGQDQEGAQALGESAMAIGRDATASGERSIAFGANNKDSDGVRTWAIGKFSNAFGSGAIAHTDNSTAIGTLANAHGNSSIVIGTTAGSEASATNATVIGTQAKAYAPVYLKKDGTYETQAGEVGLNATAIGANSLVAGNNGVGVGVGSQSTLRDAIAIGHNAFAGSNFEKKTGDVSGMIAVGAHSVAMGSSAFIVRGNPFNELSNNGSGRYVGVNKTTTDTSLENLTEEAENILVSSKGIATGFKATATTGGISHGAYAKSRQAAVAVGGGATAEGITSVALGPIAYAKGNTALALGRESAATADYAQAIGPNAAAADKGALAIGHSATAEGYSSIAIGAGDPDSAGNTETTTGIKQNGSKYQGETKTQTKGNFTMAIGATAKALADNATAIGTKTNVSAANSTAIGVNNNVAQANTQVLGNNITTTQANSVVLGSDSTDRAATAENSATVNGLTYTGFAGVGSAEKGVVSVGAAGKERQLINVAAGNISATSTDAINGSQLYRIAENSFFNVNRQAGTGNNAQINKAGKIGSQGNVTFAGSNLISAFVTGTDNNLTVTYSAAQKNIEVNTTAGTVSEGAGSSAEYNDGLALTSQVVNAISKSGWHVTAAKNGGELDGTATDELINPGETVKLQAGKNLKIKQDGNNFTYSTADNVSFTNINTTKLVVGEPGEAGKPGQTGKAGVAIDGTNGTIGLNGKDGASANIKVEKGTTTVNATDKGQSIDRVKYVDSTNKTREVATLDDGLKFVGDDGTTINRTLGSTLNISGGATANLTDNNIGVVGNATTGVLTVKLNKDLNLTDKGSLKIGDTLLNNTGLTITNGPSVTNTGINAGDKKITNVTAGELGPNSKDAVNGSQLYATNQNVTNINTTVAKGLNFAGNSGQVINKKLGETLNITGSLDNAASASAKNVRVDNESGNLTVKIADTPEFKGVNLSNNGNSVNLTTDAKGLNLSKNGANATISGVAPAELNSTSTEAVNGSQLYATNQNVTNVTNEVAKGWNVTTAKVNGSTGVSTNSTKEKVAMGDTVTVKAGNNININQDGKNIEIATSMTPTFTNVTTGDTVLSDNGLTINGGPNVTKSGIDAGSKTITNVKAGTNGTDAVNLDQLNSTVANTSLNVTNGKVDAPETANAGKLVNATVVANTINNVSWAAAENGTSKADIKAGNTVSFNNGKGTIANVTKTDKGVNVTFNVDTVKLTNDQGKVNANGTVTAPTDANKIATAQEVANAINSAGWNITAAQNGGELDGTATDELINPGETVKLQAGKNIKLKQEGNNFTYSTADNVTFTTVNTTKLIVGEPGEAGKPGENGKAGIAIDGTNGTIGLNGKDGASANIKVEKGKTTVNPDDAGKEIDRVKYVDSNNKTREVATLDDGLKFKGDNDTVINRTLGSTLNISGGANTSNLTDNNIGVVGNENGTLTVKLNKDLNLSDKGSVTIGNTTLNDGGLTIKNGPSVTNTGINAGDKKITNVTNGTLSADSKDAVNGSQLYATNQNVTNVTNEVAKGWNVTTAKVDGSTGNVEGNAPAKVAMGDTVTVKAGNNINITQNGKDIAIATSMTPTFTNVTTGDTVLSDNGLTINGGPNITKSGIDAGNKNITNVKAGTNGTDAVNLDQLNATVTGSVANTTLNVTNGKVDAPETANAGKLVNATVVANTINNVSWFVAENDANKGNVKAGSKVAFKDGTGTTANVTADAAGNVTVSYHVNTTNIAAQPNGTVQAGKAGNSFATATEVANAINNASFNATIGRDDADFTDQNGITAHKVKAGETVKLQAGKNLKVKQDGATFTYATKDDVTFTTVNTTKLIVGEPGQPGKNGVAIDGTNGTIGLNGKDGASANITVEKGKTTVNPADKGQDIDRVKYVDSNNKTREVATLDDGLKFVGDDGTTINRTLGSTLNISGGATTNLTDNNIGVMGNTTTGALTVKLNKDLNLSDKGSVTIGNTTLNDGGLTITNGPSVTNEGINAGDKKITNVTNGDLGPDSKDAVNGSQLYATNQNITNINTNVSKGLNFAGNTGRVINKQLGDTLNITGALASGVAASAKNIRVDSENGNLTVKIADTPEFTGVNLSNNGNNVSLTTDAKGLNISKDGANATISGVANATLDPSSTEAVNGSQLYATNQNVTNVTNEVAKGWNVTTAKVKDSTGVVTNNTTEKVAMGDTVTVKAGNNININQDGKNIEIATSMTPTFTNVTTEKLIVGEPGKDGKAGVAIDGTNGTIGLNGKDGASANIKVEKGTTTVNPADKGQDIDRVKYTDSNNTVREVATLDDGLKFVGDDGTTINRTLGSTLNISGGATTGLTDNNIGVLGNATTGALTVKLNKDLNLTDTGSLRIGDTLLNSTGLTITNGPSVTNTGINAGDKKITNVTAGVAPTDAVNVEQLTNTVTKAVENTTLTVTNGAVEKPSKENEGKLVNATVVAKAINESGWTVTAAEDGGTAEGASDELVNPGETVKLQAGKNVKISQKGANFTFSTADNIVVGEKGADGKDGVDGSIGVNGKDGSAVVLNGKDGSIGLTGAKGKDGKDGASTNISVQKGTTTVNEERDGGKDITRVVYSDKDKDGNNITREIATMDDGLKFKGNKGEVISKKLGETLNITGSLADDVNASAKNIRVDNENGNLTVKIAEAPEFKGITLKEGNNTVNITTNDKGLNVAKADGSNATISGVANATLNETSTEAVNGSQLYATNNNVTNLTNEVAKGWIVTTGTVANSNGVVTNNTTTKVAMGDTVTVKAGNNIQINQDGQNIEIATSATPTFTNITTNEVIVGKDGKDGANGVDGKVGVNGKDGASVVLNGKDGSIGLTGPRGADGKDGASANIKVENGAKGLDGNDGENGESKTRIVYEKPDGTKETVATMNDGLKFQGNKGEVISKKLGETLNITGSLDNAANASAKNIRVDNDNGNLTVKIAENPEFKGITLKEGDNTVNITTNANGLNVAKADGSNATISGVANATLNATSTEAVNGSQLYATNQNVTNLTNEVAKGWNVNVSAADGTNGKVEGNPGKENVAMGDTVNVKAGNNVIIKQEGKDLTISTSATPTFTNVTTNEVIVGKDGQDGVDGKVGVSGKDGSSVVLNGKDGSIGLTGATGKNGKDGASTNISVQKGTTTVNEERDGGKDITRVVYSDKDKDGNDITREIATLDDGLKFKGDNDTVINRTLGSQLNIVGGAKEANLTDNNIGVVGDSNGTLTVKLNKDLNLGNNGSVTIGNTTLNDGGLTITGGPSITKDGGINAGNKAITNVTAGTNGTDAVNVDQLNTTVAKAVENTTLSVENGKVKEVPDADKGKLVNATVVAKAINDSGWIVTAAANGGTAEGSSNELVNPGETVKLQAGQNMKVVQDGANFTFSTTNNIVLGEKGPTGDRNNTTTGSDGSLGVNGKDGSSVVINGKDGSIGLTGAPGKDGKDGASANIKVEDGAKGLDGNDGKDGESKTRIVYEKPNGEKETLATMNDGLKFKGNKGETINKKLGETLEVVGELADNAEASAKNVRVDNENGKLTVKLANQVDLGSNGSITMGNVSVNHNGINAGGNTISNVKDGDISPTSKDAVNGSQLHATNQNVTNLSNTVAKGWNVQTQVVAGSTGIVKGSDKANVAMGDTVNVLAGNNIEITQNGKDIAIATSSTPTFVNVTTNEVTVGQAGKDGKDGVDGKIGVNGKDGSSVVINGKDGSIGLTGAKGADGKDGASANIKVENGAKGLDGNDGKDGESKTRIVYEKPNGEKETVATMNDGLTFAGDTGTESKRKLGEKVTVRGGQTDVKKLSSKPNIGVISDGNGNLDVKLAKDLDLDVDGSVKVGDTIINNNGLTINGGPSITKDGGINAGGNVISNVAPGVKDTDAVNVAQLKHQANRIGDLDNKVNKNKKRADAGTASVAAMANIPQVYLPGKSGVGIGIGNRGGQTAVAIGYSRTSDNAKHVIKFSAGMDSQHTGTVGAGYMYQW